MTFDNGFNNTLEKASALDTSFETDQRKLIHLYDKKLASNQIGLLEQEKTLSSLSSYQEKSKFFHSMDRAVEKAKRNDQEKQQRSTKRDDLVKVDTDL